MCTVGIRIIDWISIRNRRLLFSLNDNDSVYSLKRRLGFVNRDFNLMFIIGIEILLLKHSLCVNVSFQYINLDCAKKHEERSDFF